jgi:large subunit ribosomal protein L25
MALGASVTAGDLSLPRGVTLAVEPDVLVLHVISAPTAAQIEAELGEEAAAAEAAPGEIAPAEGGGAAESEPSGE